MKHCCARAQAKPSHNVGESLAAVCAALKSDRRSDGEETLERNILHRDRLHDLEQQRIVRDRSEPAVCQTVRFAQLFWPGVRLFAQCVSKRRQKGDQRRANAGILLQKLRHQHERSREIRGGIFRFALREQHAAEIVANLCVIRLELQHAFVMTHGVIELAQAFALGRVDEQLLNLIAGGISGKGTGRRPCLCVARRCFRFIGREFLGS